MLLTEEAIASSRSISRHGPELSQSCLSGPLGAIGAERCGSHVMADGRYRLAEPECHESFNCSELATAVGSISKVDCSPIYDEANTPDTMS